MAVKVPDKAADKAGHAPEPSAILAGWWREMDLRIGIPFAQIATCIGGAIMVTLTLIALARPGG